MLKVNRRMTTPPVRQERVTSVERSMPMLVSVLVSVRSAIHRISAQAPAQSLYANPHSLLVLAVRCFSTPCPSAVF